MPIKPNMFEYFQSLTGEIMAKAKRIRQLIGSRHWLTDGTHKEAIISESIRPFFGDRLRISKGFLLGDVESHCCSKEQDILLMDNDRDAALYNVAGVSISLGRSAIAAISVKSALQKKSLWDALSGLQSAFDAARADRNTNLSTAAIFFDEERAWRGRPEKVYQSIQEWFVKEAGRRSLSRSQLISDIMLVVLPTHAYICEPSQGNANSIRVNGYDTDQLAMSLLVGRIAECCPKRSASDTTSIYDSLSRHPMSRLEPETKEFDINGG